jgi:hypothetical protein
MIFKCMKKGFLLIICMVYFCYNSLAQTLPSDSIIINSLSGVGGAHIAKIDIVACYPDGFGGWASYLSSQVKTDVPIKHSAPLGKYRVIIRFAIERDGTIDSVQALTHCGYGMEEEVMRVIAKSRKWHPAILNGQPSRTVREQPFEFVIDQNSYTH